MSSWTPNSFISRGNAEGFQNDYLQSLVSEGRKLTERGLPALFTLGHLAAICDVPFGFLHDIVSRRSDPYRVFLIKKKAGGLRRITVPSPPLQVVQRWLHTDILSHQPTHSCSQAFNEGCSPMKNAQQHCSSKWLVKIDVENFFESVSERQVYRVFKGIGFRPLLCFELSRLCTRIVERSRQPSIASWQKRDRYSIGAYRSENVGRLPQGAPTSPLLANLVCFDLDIRLNALAGEFACSYTRYADDIVFSARDFDRLKARRLIDLSVGVLAKYGFKRNLRKTTVVPPGARRLVTGLLVDGAEVKLQRRFREAIELHLHYAAKHGIARHCEYRKFRSLFGFKNHLHGLITYAESVDPKFGARCRSEFEALPWGAIGMIDL
jgi:RNA-directed DNA polymerase